MNIASSHTLKTEPTEPAASRLSKSTALSELQQEMIETFVNIAALLALPRSIGEIYGLLFATEEPLSLDDVVERLHMSKGAASGGLRWLRAMGAIRLNYQAGQRRDYFAAETELRQLISSLVAERIDPHLQNGRRRVARLEELAEKPSNRSDFAKSRVTKLRRWQQMGEKAFPLIKAIAMKIPG